MTWNCRRGPYARKLAGILSEEPDITVLTESGPPKEPDTPNRAWIDGGNKLGIAVLTAEPYFVRALPCAPALPRLTAPVAISGPVSFTILAVWTWREPTYHEPLHRALEAYVPIFDEGPVVVTGDFNLIGHGARPKREVANESVDNALRALGLASAYHYKYPDVPGQEARPTHYHKNHRDKPFHIDYCYVPVSWLPAVRSVRVGTFEEFSSMSDHRPLIVDFAW